MIEKSVLATFFALLAVPCLAQTESLESVDSEFAARISLLEKLDCGPDFILRDQGASIGLVHGFYVGKSPELPIFDKDGSIHPSSCNPHINFLSKELNKEKLKSLLPYLKKLRPSNRASHLALYLPKQLHDDKPLVEDLKKQLPHCQIYYEHHKANSHRIPVNRATN